MEHWRSDEVLENGTRNLAKADWSASGDNPSNSRDMNCSKVKQ